MEAALAAYEAAFLVDDHGAMMALMTDDVTFCDPLSGEIKSRVALEKHLAQAGGVLKDIRQPIETKSITGLEVFLKWQHTGTNSVTGKQYSFPGYIASSEGWL